MQKVLICGAGGFIGGHLASRFSKDKKIELICVDLKPLDYWFQKFNRLLFCCRAYQLCLTNN